MDYLELSVDDLGKAKRFYAEAFGWSFRDYGPSYSGILIHGVEAGGLAAADVERISSFQPMQAETRMAAPLMVLYSNDLEASLEQVKSAGGLIVKEIFEFPGGRRFQFQDRQLRPKPVHGAMGAGAHAALPATDARGRRSGSAGFRSRRS